jgi:hypothetical protein
MWFRYIQLPIVRKYMVVNAHERLSNFSLRHRLNMIKGTACSKKGYGCKWTWEAIQG